MVMVRVTVTVKVRVRGEGHGAGHEQGAVIGKHHASASGNGQ